MIFLLLFVILFAFHTFYVASKDLLVFLCEKTRQRVQYFFLNLLDILGKTLSLDLKYWISFWDRVGNKFLVKSRDSIFDTTAPSHYTVRWVSLQWRRWKTCETAKFISFFGKIMKQPNLFPLFFSPQKPVKLKSLFPYSKKVRSKGSFLEFTASTQISKYGKVMFG